MYKRLSDRMAFYTNLRVHFSHLVKSHSDLWGVVTRLIQGAQGGHTFFVGVGREGHYYVVLSEQRLTHN